MDEYLIGVRLREPEKADDYKLVDLFARVGDLVLVESAAELLVGEVRRPRRPVPARSSYGGRARSESLMGRHASPDSSARACASRMARAASARLRRRARNPASGGASSCIRMASAHACWAVRAVRHASSFATETSVLRRSLAASLI